MRSNIEKFGRAVMEKVRDKAIGVTANRLYRRPHNSSEEWMASLDGLNESQRTAIDRLLRLHTDQTIAEFLGLFEDDDSFRIMVDGPEGKTFDAVREGDNLAAAPFGRRGWIATFSKYPPEGS